MLLAGEDKKLVQGLKDVPDRWGGNFKVKGGVSWRREAKRWKEEGGKVVHLTMYGSNLPEVIDEIRSCDKIMVAVGAEKVPAEMYQLADWNVGVGNQPHSEVAALAVFLDRLQEGKELEEEFEGKIRIVPNPRYKTVVERSSDKTTN